MGRKAPSSGSSGVFNGVNGVLHIKYADRGVITVKGGSRIAQDLRGTCGAMCVSLMRLLITGHCH